VAPRSRELSAAVQLSGSPSRRRRARSIGRVRWRGRGGGGASAGLGAPARVGSRLASSGASARMSSGGASAGPMGLRLTSVELASCGTHVQGSGRASALPASVGGRRARARRACSCRVLYQRGGKRKKVREEDEEGGEEIDTWIPHQGY
jgi:hypothetical protein